VEKVKKSLFYRIKKERAAYFFILPLFLLFVVFLFKPIIEAIILSFYKVNLQDLTWIGLTNYFNLFKEPIFWLELKNTLIFVIFFTPACITLALLLSAIMFKLPRSLQSFFRGAFYLPAVSAGVVTSMVWLWIFNPSFGLLNYFLSLMHMKPVIWLGSPNPARFAVMVVVLTWLIGTHIILYLAALAAIPKTVYEAAQIDGANSYQKFFQITIPLVMPTTVYLFVTLTIGIFQICDVIFLLTGGGPMYSTASIAYRIYQLGFLYFRFGEASTQGVALLIIVFTASFLQFKYLNKKLEF